ncbi:MAG: glycosyltransferase family 2 protein [Sulfitobacter sp.]|nr:glycosyltransferase family 2 protein [Sulfitobacter sp.]
MTPLSVSVVVVSRNRATALTRCLTGISQLQYPTFEVVVVSDPAGLAAARALPFADDLKLVEYDEANISAARNLGLIHAAGEIIAFIDDDAVPEPQWLRHLIAPASQSDVAAMGGFVRGRNGISFQWRARRLDPFGEGHDLPLKGDAPRVLTAPEGQAVKTEGTNMSLRRSVLIDLGGFDPAYHYFLDETDLNMRLARAGHRTAIVPLAQVHHGFAANALRRPDRVPRDLFDIGASWAVFHRKHLPDAARAEHWARLRRAERARLLRHMVRGALDPFDVTRLMGRLDEGHAAGLTRDLTATRLPQHPQAPFRAFPATKRESNLILTNPIHARRDRQEAATRVAAGQIVSLFNFSPSALYHQVSFTDGGFWEQRGGLFGRSDRNGPLIQPTSRKRRLAAERRRIAALRGLTPD